MCFSRFLIVPIQFDAHCSNPPFPLAERASSDHPRALRRCCLLADLRLVLSGSPTGLLRRDPRPVCFFSRSAVPPPFARRPPDSVGPPQWSLCYPLRDRIVTSPRTVTRSRSHARSSSSGRIRPLCCCRSCRQQRQPTGARRSAMPARVRPGRNDHRLVAPAHGTALRDRTVGLCLCRRLCRVRPPSRSVDGAAAGRGAAATKGYHCGPHRDEEKET